MLQQTPPPTDTNLDQCRSSSGSPESPIVVQTEHLAKTYVIGFFRKKIHAAKDVSLTVKRGEIFGLLGPNGAGKTTTLKVLMSLVRPSSGKAEVLGQPVGSIAAKRRIGYLPETPHFYDYLTSMEFLTFVGQLFGLGLRESRRRATDLIARVGLAHARALPLRRYSKGMLQRVGLAQALINDPELVVLDEPLTGLDPLGRKQLRDIIAELGREGKTVIFSSHILSDVERLADEAAILVGGRTVAHGPLDQLVQARILGVEILIARANDPLVQALQDAGHGPQQRGETLRVELIDELGVDAVVDLCRQHGASLQSITPRRESLEDVVVGKVEADRQGQTAAAGVAL